MKNNKKIVLKGEGANQHVLHGNFDILQDEEELLVLKLIEDSLLKHEDIIGNWSDEHKILVQEKGTWVLAKQVEFNPLTQDETRVWD